MKDGEKEPRERHDAFGVKRRAVFLDALAETCNVAHSARAAGCARKTAYQAYRREPAFAAAWVEALGQGYHRLEEKLLAHALAAVGDTAGPVEARVVVTGRSVLPPAPVHLRAAPTADGGALVTWVRRSRAGWGWVDGVDAPLGEEREAWEVLVERADGSARAATLDATPLRIDAAERAGGAVTVSVRQVGDLGLGSAAAVVVPGSDL